MSISKNNKQKIIQPMLEVGTQNDSFENEADSVAREVVSSDSPSSKMENSSGIVQRMSNDTSGIQKMSDGNSGIKISSPVKDKVENNSGGENLSFGVQQEMEGKIGADFSGVKLHHDASAHEMNKEMGAKAFTYGNDIYFNHGQYNPVSHEGKQLIAHELVHTVQQGYAGARSIQKKILIAGKEHGYSEEFAKGLAPLGLQIYNSMIKSATEFSFNDEPALKVHIETEEKLRNALISIAKTDDENCSFGMGVSTPSDSWQKVDAYSEPKDEKKSSDYALGLSSNTNVLPSDAVKSLFNKDNKSTFDCSGMMMANVYGAMSQTLGPDAFNKLYAGDKRKDLIVSPEFLYFKDEESQTFKDHPLLESGMYEKTNLASKDELIPGDWVYFHNSQAYYMVVGSGGAWMGEHAAYLGKEGEEMKFKGFGISTPLTETEMLAELNNASYNGMKHSYMATMKAVEQWAPTPELRAPMFLTLRNSRLAGIMFVEKKADGYHVIPDSFTKSKLKQAHGVDVGEVTLPLTEYDPDNKIYTEPDIEGKTFSGQMPGLGKKDVLRPRVDKMK